MAPRGIRRLYGKIRTAGPFDREDRLVLVNEILRCQDPSYPTIESFKDLDQDEIDYLLEALRHWEVIQESRLYAGVLALDQDVMALAEEYRNARQENHS